MFPTFFYFAQKVFQIHASFLGDNLLLPKVKQFRFFLCFSFTYDTFRANLYPSNSDTVWTLNSIGRLQQMNSQREKGSSKSYLRTQINAMPKNIDSKLHF